MKHSIIVKFLAFVLCAMSLVALVFSGFGIAFMQAYDLYRNPLEVIQRDQMNYASSTLAEHYAQLHAAKTLGNAPASLLDNIYNSYYIDRMGSQYAVEIYEKGKLVESINNAADLQGETFSFTYSIPSKYPIVTSEVYQDDLFVTEPNVTMPAATEPPDLADHAIEITPTEDPFGITVAKE